MECIQEKSINVFENLLSSEKTLPPTFKRWVLISQAKTQSTLWPFRTLVLTACTRKNHRLALDVFPHSKAVKTSLNRVGLGGGSGLGLLLLHRCFSNNFSARKIPGGLCKITSSVSTCSYGWAAREKSGGVVGFIVFFVVLFWFFFSFFLSIFFLIYLPTRVIYPLLDKV